MNQPGVLIPEHEQQDEVQGQMNEIPSYPGAEQYQPGEGSTESTTPYVPVVERYVPIQYEAPKPTAQVDLYNAPEQQHIPKSSLPELQTAIAPETTRSGEKIFVNPELGQSTFKGGVSSTQLVSKVAGYYTVQQGLVSDPKSGLLQQTAATGDPASASTWQATILFKILQAFWSILGISN